MIDVDTTTSHSVMSFRAKWNVQIVEVHSFVIFVVVVE